jgi:hypothetical protein
MATNITLDLNNALPGVDDSTTASGTTFVPLVPNAVVTAGGNFADTELRITNLQATDVIGVNRLPADYAISATNNSRIVHHTAGGDVAVADFVTMTIAGQKAFFLWFNSNTTATDVTALLQALDFRGKQPNVPPHDLAFSFYTSSTSTVITTVNSSIGEPYAPVDAVVCFLEGTGIMTRMGSRPVESLQPGDEVMTLNHGWQAVRWLGRREVGGKDAAPPPTFAERPIRIARDAFGSGLPTRPLWVSPDHGVFFRNHLIPAKHLVNGSTVSRDGGVGRIVYYHVLLERHSVIYSEGLPTESYIPSENQHFFENAIDIPAELAEIITCRVGPMAADCYPRTSTGAVVESARAYLAERAPASELDRVA